jgi:hypothetical protein
VKALQIKIAETVISAVGDDSCPQFRVDPAYQKFFTENAAPDIRLRVHFGEIPDLPRGEMIFHSGSAWSIHRQQAKFLVTFSLPGGNSPPFRLAVFNGTFSSCDLYIRPGPPNTPLDARRDELTVDPLLAPFDQMLLVHFLGQRRQGIILHACGVVDGNQGLAFCGASGAGKSTLAQLWQQSGTTVLSDERLVVRLIDHRFFIYGTPWHGDSPIFSAQGAPLHRLYMISHAAQNSLRLLSPGWGAAQLFICCFPAFHNRVAMENSVTLLGQLAAAIPCYELGFVPHLSAVDFIRCHR